MTTKNTCGHERGRHTAPLRWRCHDCGVVAVLGWKGGGKVWVSDEPTARA